MRAPKATVKKARALRREPTFPEILLWQLLRGDRQPACASGAGIGSDLTSSTFSVRFWGSPSSSMVRPTTIPTAWRDARRDLWLAGQGIGVLRFPARDLLTEEGRQCVLATIAARAEASDAPSTLLRRSPSSVSRGRNSPVSLDSASAAP